jgi:hypothetical protein
MSTRVTFGIIVAIVTIVAANDIAHGASLPSTSNPPVTATTSQAANAPALKTTFSQAIEAAAELGSPTAAYQQTALGAVQSRHPVPAFTSTQRIDLQAAGKAAIARYFAAPQSTAEQTLLAKAMALDANPNVINLGSGISKLDFRAVTVTASQATVVADVTTWAKSAARLNPLARWVLASPVSRARYTATLRLSPDGTWRITSLATAFATSP